MKMVFSGNKTPGQGSGADLNFFFKICLKFLAFSSFFNLFVQKTLKKHISTSVWSTRGKNAGRNIQQSVLILKHNLYVDTFF